MPGRVSIGAARCPEVVDLLPRRPHAIADDVGKECAEPRPAREDVDLRHAALEQLLRLHGLGAIRSTRFHEHVAHDAARAARRQRPRARLEPDRLHSLKVDLRITPHRVVERDLIDGEPDLVKDRHRRSNVRVITAVQPQRPRLDVDRLGGRRFELLPKLVRALHHLDINAIGAVDRADDARLAAGARSRVPRSPRIDERDLRAALQQMERRPAAECAGADDHNARFGGVQERRFSLSLLV